VVLPTINIMRLNSEKTETAAEYHENRC